jgi:hypothetical protein
LLRVAFMFDKGKGNCKRYYLVFLKVLKGRNESPFFKTYYNDIRQSSFLSFLFSAQPH